MALTQKARLGPGSALGKSGAAPKVVGGLFAFYRVGRFADFRSSPRNSTKLGGRAAHAVPFGLYVVCIEPLNPSPAPPSRKPS